MYVCNPVPVLSNVVQQIRCWTRNEDVWFLVLFLPNFVSTLCYFKLWVKVLIHPGKVLWLVQVALMKSTKAVWKMTQAQKTPNILKFFLWSYLIMQSEAFESQRRITPRKPTSHIPTPWDSGIIAVLPGCTILRRPRVLMLLRGCKARLGGLWETLWLKSKPIPGRY